MSRLYDLLEHIINKVNMSVKFDEEQVLTDAQKQIVLTKLGINNQGETVITPTVEPAENDIPKVYIDGTIPTTKTENDAVLRYKSNTEDFTAYIKIKCQGTSSLSYPKKNFTIKLYEDEGFNTKLKKDFKGWGAQNKFCLKANWIDLSHARNIVCARLWGEVVKSRNGYDSYPEEFKNSPNRGAVDGFPFYLYCNGHYWGRYTWNIPKDGWMVNMDKNLDTHCILCSEDYNSSCFRAEAVIDGTDWTDELHDTVPNSILTRWNEVITFVRTSTDDDFVANISNYFDLESIIDYYIFSYVICHLDGLGKNQLFFTYDGQKWIASAYDMDSTIGLYWDGSSFVSTSYKMQENYETGVNGTSNLLYERLGNLFTEQIQARWEFLKTSVLDKYHMIELFENFCDLIPSYIIEQDYNRNTGSGNFTSIPSVYDNNISQIREYIVNRYNYVNTKISSGGGTTTGETILRQNYSPNNVSWIDETTINFANGDYIEISLSVANCVNKNENIISVGNNIAQWMQVGYHVYYTPGSVQINTLNGHSYAQHNKKLSTTDLILKINSDGIYLNDKLITTCPDLNSITDIQIGSQEGHTRSQATYNYIKVVIA